jgi:hypothetical protein
VQRALEDRELMSVWTRQRNSIPKEYRSRLSARIKRYVDRWVDCLHSCYPGRSRDVLNAAVHATHGLIDSIAIWPEQSLRINGLDDILTGMALQGLEWLGASASRTTPASKRPRQKANRSA